jgi:hypothetical protein
MHSYAGTQGNISCQFIPPTLVQKLPPIVVEGNGSYSLDEIQLPDRWYNGKPIYRRVFTGNITAAANAINTFPLVSNVEALVNCGGCIQLSNDDFWQLGWQDSSNLSSSMIYFRKLGGVIRMWTRAYVNRDGITNSAYEVWVEYTKLSD